MVNGPTGRVDGPVNKLKSSAEVPQMLRHIYADRKSLFSKLPLQTQDGSSCLLIAFTPSCGQNQIIKIRVSDREKATSSAPFPFKAR